MSWSAHLASLVIWAWAFAPTTEGCAQSEQLPFELLPELPVEIGVGGPITGSHEGALIVGGGANFPVPLVEGGEKVWHDEVFVLLESAGPWREAGRLPRRLAYAACTSTELGIVVAGGLGRGQCLSRGLPPGVVSVGAATRGARPSCTP